uniref:BZIP domain-containing protein n=1 Tax=Sander lucioperca TaxID=283035 RepID=A0A8C9Z5E7_SANLU
MVMSMPLIVNCTHSLAVGCGNISVREKTLKGTVGSRSSMAVTGDETETGTSGDMTACQLCNTSSSLPQGVANTSMGSAGASAHSDLKPGKGNLQKRELRLMKNREAARECRRKKKEYVKCLENRVALLENQNKTLIEELRALKDIYRHKVE